MDAPIAFATVVIAALPRQPIPLRKVNLLRRPIGWVIAVVGESADPHPSNCRHRFPRHNKRSAPLAGHPAAPLTPLLDTTHPQFSPNLWRGKPWQKAEGWRVTFSLVSRILQHDTPCIKLQTGKFSHPENQWQICRSVMSRGAGGGFERTVSLGEDPFQRRQTKADLLEERWVVRHQNEVRMLRP